MKRQRQSHTLLQILLFGLLLVYFSGLSSAKEADPTTAASTEEDGALLDNADDFEILEEEGITVEDYLSRLGIDELHKICLDRGLDVEEGSVPLTRDDYVEAARRCLSLEDEMNAILNEHPELAAEIEKEIERLQTQKARLEEERDAMLKEKELLEAQLEQAGVDLENFKAQGNASVAPKDPANMSFPELLLESFRQLFERVKQDFKFVAKVTQPVWENARDRKSVV